MKLVVAVIQDYDTDTFLKAITAHNLMATRIASAGGFLRAGNTTVFMAVEDDEVALVKRLLSQCCRNRQDQSLAECVHFLDSDEFEHVVSSRIGGGVAFVARLSHFEKISRATNQPAGVKPVD